MSMDDLAGRKALIKTSGLKEGRILDIGMGNCGCMSFFLAKRGFDVIGIDRSPNAVHESRKDAKKEKFKGTFKAKLANAENLPFEDGEFDAVFAYHSMHHIDNMKKAIDEMFRVCKQGGFILIAELHQIFSSASFKGFAGIKSLRRLPGLSLEPLATRPNA
jgi:ubiquinone/menaquinone biosynthesis C-methylase UbiE